MPDLTKKDFRIGINTQLDHQLAYISPKFENQVISHIIGNYMNLSPFPLFLAIHGKKGEGKTFQTLRTCSKYRLSIYYISGAQLCGSFEKDSIGDIEENYNRALEKFRTANEISVIIIDDFHLSIASTEAGIGRTVNSQILTGFLMNLADKAKTLKRMRVPFILLGNDFNNLYEPFTRDGRMDFFEWNPNIQEKTKIVSSHFDDIVKRSEMNNLAEMIRKYIQQPISFFTEIKNDIYKNIVSQHIIQHNYPDANTMLNGLNSMSISLSYVPISEIEQNIIHRIDTQKHATHEERSGLHDA